MASRSSPRCLLLLRLRPPRPRRFPASSRRFPPPIAAFPLPSCFPLLYFHRPIPPPRRFYIPPRRLLSTCSPRSTTPHSSVIPSFLHPPVAPCVLPNPCTMHPMHPMHACAGTCAWERMHWWVGAHALVGGSACTGGWERMHWWVGAHALVGGSACTGGWPHMALAGGLTWHHTACCAFIGLLGTVGPTYTGVIVADVGVALFGLVAVASGYQALGRTYAALLMLMLLLDSLWLALFAPHIWCPLRPPHLVPSPAHSPHLPTPSCSSLPAHLLVLSPSSISLPALVSVPAATGTTRSVHNTCTASHASSTHSAPYSLLHLPPPSLPLRHTLHARLIMLDMPSLTRLIMLDMPSLTRLIMLDMPSLSRLIMLDMPSLTRLIMLDMPSLTRLIMLDMPSLTRLIMLDMPSLTRLIMLDMPSITRLIMLDMPSLSRLMLDMPSLTRLIMLDMPSLTFPLPNPTLTNSTAPHPSPLLESEELTAPWRQHPLVALAVLLELTCHSLTFTLRLLSALLWLQLLRLGLAHAREGIAWHCRVFLRISQSQLAPSVPRPSVTSTNSRLGLADGIEAVAMARPWPSQRLSRILKSQRDPLLPIPRVQMLRLGLADSREPTPVPTSEVHAYLPAYDSLGPYRPASSATPDLSPTAGRERAVGDEFVGSAIFHPSAFATLFQSDTLLNYLSEVRSSSQTPSSTTSLRCAHLLNYLSEDGSSSAPNSLDSSYGGHPVAAGAEDTEVHGWDGVIWGDVM
ncbi:unnamed protein product [Closterium sp. NIES-65]|nr:unnamed protein product [Closterium sp. NIES-65]